MLNQNGNNQNKTTRITLQNYSVVVTTLPDDELVRDQALAQSYYDQAHGWAGEAFWRQRLGLIGAEIERREGGGV